MSQFKGACLVTGGARRIGRAICLKMAELGLDIALHYNCSESEAHATANDIIGLGRDVELFRADLTRSHETASLVEFVVKRFPGLNLLVNSASIWRPVSFMESEAVHLRENLSVHLEAPYILCRDFARQIGRGVIINIVDTAVLANQTNFFPYLLTKKALYQLTGQLARELAPHVRVNAVAPGMVLPAEGSAQAVHERKLVDNPLGREGSPCEVAEAVAYLAGAQHVTGQTLFVDGGEHLH